MTTTSSAGLHLSHRSARTLLVPHPVKYYSIIFGNRATEDVLCVHVFPQAREHRETQIPSQAREQSEAVQQEGQGLLHSKECWMLG